MQNKIKAISLFSSSGIGEFYLNELGIDVIAANELLNKRADLYSYLYPNAMMILGDIKDTKIKEKIKSMINKDVKLLIATPPCQGVSSLGKNKKQLHYESDSRNYLIFHIFEIIESANFDYILIENVPRFLEMYFPFEDKLQKLEDILITKFGKKYNLDIQVLDAKDYGVPQTRPRAIIKMYKKDLKWS
jgi:DNA (cytosine-5)-methyltransferase 1